MKLEIKEFKCVELSAGICDNCKVPKVIKEGDGINEPFHSYVFCNKLNIEITPERPEDRLKSCKHFLG